MRTRLSQFCDHFVSTLRPLLVPLEQSVAAFGGRDPEGRVAASGDPEDGRVAASAETGEHQTEADSQRSALRAELIDLEHQVQGLCDKVAGQRSYVLIFGPLKSGKSTLMNAIAGSYVSEVSSLPAYPCLVFVSHGGAGREYLVTDYDGGEQRFGDPDALRQRIDAAHVELAQHIRLTEEAGELFDPQRHFPGAIRRVDVRVEAPNLEASGAVLVDTPGLYTRMRFGYDRMTRDFRNAAACAIFVVKSDTLFLEQVFTEFNQLLELFSRVFVVVNTDSTKRDVGADGSLVPSLEQKSPERIIEAFENLAMPAPLRAAASEGRVRLYAVDLMQAASEALRAAHAGDKDPTAETAPKAAGFAAFRDDLRDYLASTDYLFAFLRDSLQRAEHLLIEARDLAGSEFTADLRTELQRVGARAEAQREGLHRIEALRRRDWQKVFATFDRELAGELERVSRDRGSRIATAMAASIETWMLSSHSLLWLLDTTWRPQVQEYVDALHQAARRCFDQSCGQHLAGMELTGTEQDLLASLDVGGDLRSLRQRARETLDLDQPVDTPRIPLDVEKIPIRRGVLDVLSLRSADRVRDRLFGDPEAPDVRIPARQKATRLGDPAKKFLNQFLLGFRDSFFADTVAGVLHRYTVELRDRTTAALVDRVMGQEPDIRARLSQSDSRAAELRRVLDPLAALSQSSDEVRSKVHALSTQFAATDIDTLLVPLPRREEPAPARPPRSRQRESNR